MKGIVNGRIRGKGGRKGREIEGQRQINKETEELKTRKSKGKEREKIQRNEQFK
jgi:hypothetical protein